MRCFLEKSLLSVLTKYRRYVTNEKGMALLAVLGLLTVFMGMGSIYFYRNVLEVGLVINEENIVQSFYASETGLNWGLRQLREEKLAVGKWISNWQHVVTTYAGETHVAFMREDYTPGNPFDDYFNSRHGWLYATTVNARGHLQHTLIVEVRLIWNIPITEAALTGPNAGQNTLVLDGRDHSMVVPDEATLGWSPQVISNNGTLAIMNNVGIFNRTENMTIGGTTADTFEDIVPTMNQGGATGWGRVVNLAGTIPATPDEVMKFPEGYLKSQAQTDGTYYLNPADGMNLVCQDGGVYYMEFDAAIDINFNGLNLTMATPDSSAIVVIHHADPTNYSVKVVNTTGLFKGILISDKMKHLNGDIVGGAYAVGAADTICHSNGGLYYSNDVVGDLVGDFIDLWGEDDVVIMQVS